MNPFLLPVLVAAPAPEPPPVVVQARALRLPGLPVNTTEARAGYPAIRQEIEISLGELGRDLAILRVGTALDFPLEVQVAPQTASEALFLLQALSDEDFLDARGAVLESWDAWQTALLRAGLADKKEGSAITSNMELLPAGIPIFVPDDMGGDECCRIVFGRSRKEERLFSRKDLFELVAIAKAPYQRQSALGGIAAELARTHTPRLQENWKAFMEHLNTSALHWLDFEQSLAPTQNAGLEILRRQARIHVLERFRSALWLCQVIWAHMASDILPKPLQKSE
jgi:hypothetical protein